MIVTLALVALAGVSGALTARPVAAQQVPSTSTRYISVIGHGEIKVRPDTAIIQIGVETQAATAKDALAQNTTQTQAVQKKLTDLGIDTKDIQTTNFGIYPVYGTDGRQVTGYRVTNSVSVKIRGIDKAGTLLDQVVQAGANSIYGISFTVDNTQNVMNQAREAAMRDAKARADLLAKAGGATVGEVLIINENLSQQPIPYAVPARAEAAQMDSAVPVQPGEQSYTADIQVTYALR
jgi:uncharacterized protein YggE